MDHIEKARNLIRSAVHKKGILASPQDKDNYKRIWARDSVIAGLAGILINDNLIKNGLKKSLNTLATYQHYSGFIPSNVGVGRKTIVSYGTLTGRVDSTLWYIIGVCLYFKNTKDKSFLDKHKNHIYRSLNTLETWEFNGRHLIYTPLSGNWADEYPMHGYLLYDNSLRLWALKLVNDVFHKKINEEKLKAIQKTIATNFWPENKKNHKKWIYHKRLYQLESLEPKSHFLAGFHPAGSYKMFDTAGHAIASLAGIPNKAQKDQIIQFVKELITSFKKPLLPAFWPVIEKGDILWDQVENNYSYSFKNKPHHFHNGGIWPVMMGLFLFSYQKEIPNDLCNTMTETFNELLLRNNYQFSEYLDSVDFNFGGQKLLCFSAAGTIFMNIPSIMLS